MLFPKRVLGSTPLGVQRAGVPLDSLCTFGPLSQAGTTPSHPSMVTPQVVLRGADKVHLQLVPLSNCSLCPRSNVFPQPCPSDLSHFLSYLEHPWPGGHVDSGLVPSTLLQAPPYPEGRGDILVSKPSPPVLAGGDSAPGP